MTVTTWMIRYGHVLGGAVWVGGYALLALVIVPLLERERSATAGRMAITAVRVLTYAGTLTLGFGIALIIASFATVVALLGIGDGALCPALRRLAAGQEDGMARRWALTGFALTVLAIGMMTRAFYVGS